MHDAAGLALPAQEAHQLHAMVTSKSGKAPCVRARSPGQRSYAVPRAREASSTKKHLMRTKGTLLGTKTARCPPGRHLPGPRSSALQLHIAPVSGLEQPAWLQAHDRWCSQHPADQVAARSHSQSCAAGWRPAGWLRPDARKLEDGHVQEVQVVSDDKQCEGR